MVSGSRGYVGKVAALDDWVTSLPGVPVISTGSIIAALWADPPADALPGSPLLQVVQHPGPGVTRITGWHLLNNEGVNFVASAATAALTAAMSIYIF
jgi:uncharacterized membrane protein